MLSEREQQHVKRIAKKHRSRAKIVNAESIPARDTDDAYGNPFLGLPGNRLEVDAVNSDELASGDNDSQRAVNTAHMQNQLLAGRHFIGTSAPYRLPSSVKVALGTDTDGTLDVNDLGGGGAGHVIDKDLIPGIGSLNGSASAGQLPNIAGLNGDLPLSRTTGDLGPGRVPGLAKLKGKVKAHSQIDWGNGPSIPPSAVRDGYDYRRLDHKPSLKKFLTRADFRADGTLKR